MLDYIKNLKTCTLLTTGRTGSDFLQSLLDSHPQVLTFNGHFDYYGFWESSQCVKAKYFEPIDFIDEFIGHHIEKFKSRYDIPERKDKLGKGFDQNIDINIIEFKRQFISLIDKNKLTSQNCLLAIYGAYAKVLNQDLTKKKVFFHHLHHHNRLDKFINDFPSTKIISMSRDPRANIVSGVLHHKAYNPESMGGKHQYLYIKRILEDSSVLEKYNNDYISIRLEDLGSTDIVKKLAVWLGIEYNETLHRSTWAGLEWHGDRLSGNKKTGGKFSKEILQNNWESYLSRKDKYILNFLMNDRLKHYGYSYKQKSVISYILVPFINLFPLKYEKEMLSITHIFTKIKDGKAKLVLRDIIHFLKRIILFQKYYLKGFKVRTPKYNILK